jgi:cysteinyl-tRNA synthetase
VGVAGPQHVGERDQNLVLFLEETKANVRAALCDDFDTPTAVGHLKDLIRETNKYIEGGVVGSAVLTSAAKYITSVLRTFGLIQDDNEIGFSLESAGGESAGNKEELLTPYLDVLTEFRRAVRLAAMSK